MSNEYEKAQFIESHQNGLFAGVCVCIGATVAAKTIELVDAGATTHAVVGEAVVSGAAFIAATIFAWKEFIQDSQSEQ